MCAKPERLPCWVCCWAGVFWFDLVHVRPSQTCGCSCHLEPHTSEIASNTDMMATIVDYEHEDHTQGKEKQQAGRCYGAELPQPDYLPLELSVRNEMGPTVP
ncbi:uncharacterized protein LOC144332766 [Macaca mulatta]